jgi:hypothetical protein
VFVGYIFSPLTERKPSKLGKKKNDKEFYPTWFDNTQHFFQSKILSDISRFFFPASKRFFRDHPPCVYCLSCCQNPIGHGDLWQKSHRFPTNPIHPPFFSFYTYNKKGQQQLVVGRFFCVYIYVATVAMVTKDCVRTLLLYVRNKMFEEEIEISFFFRVQVLMRNWLDVGIDSFDHKRSINFYSFRVKKTICL